MYLKKGELTVELLGRGFTWLDTHPPVAAAGAQFVETIEERQNLKIGSPEEVAFRMGYIGAEQLLAAARGLGKSSYGAYLRALVKDR